MELEEAVDLAIQKHVAPRLLENNDRAIKMVERYIEVCRQLERKVETLEHRLGAPRCPTCGRGHKL